MLISKRRVIENTLIKTHFWKYLNTIAELKSITYSNQCLIIEFFNFLETDTTKKLTNQILSEYHTK